MFSANCYENFSPEAIQKAKTAVMLHQQKNLLMKLRYLLVLEEQPFTDIYKQWDKRGNCKKTNVTGQIIY